MSAVAHCSRCGQTVPGPGSIVGPVTTCPRCHAPIGNFAASAVAIPTALPGSPEAEVNPYLSPAAGALAEPGAIAATDGANDTIAWIALALPVIAGVVNCFVVSASWTYYIVSYGMVVATSILIAVDASLLNRRLNRLVRDGNPIGLFIGGLLLWVVVFPLSFFLRRRMGGGKLLAPLALVSAAVFFGIPILAAVMRPAELPACDSAEAKQTIEQIVTTAPAFQRFDRHDVRIEGYQQVSFDPVKQERVGRCMLETDTESIPLSYTITWQDRSKNMFYLKLIKE